MSQLPNLFALTGTDLRQMNDDEASNLIHLIISRVVTDEPQSLEFFDSGALGPVDRFPLSLNIIVERLKSADPALLYSPKAILFASLLCDRPGVAMIWTYALFAASRDGTPTTMDWIIGDDGPFAMGVPTEEAYHRLWDAQKEPGAPLGNLLDKPSTWKGTVDADA